MLPETIRLIEQAVAETHSPTAPQFAGDHGEWLMRSARVWMNRANGAAAPEEEREHALRAIAYLVRRLELDAAP